MRKLRKKFSSFENSIEAYNCFCSCPCNCVPAVTVPMATGSSNGRLMQQGLTARS